MTRMTKKLVKVGQSLGIIIDRPIITHLNLRKGDYIDINIRRAENGMERH